MHGVHAVHAQYVHWGYCIDLPTYFIGQCMCFQAVKGMIMAHTALCPLTWLLLGITVSYTQSNGDRVPVTVIRVGSM